MKKEPVSDFKPYTVPGDMLFVMVDNRNRSNDSRYWGPVPLQNIIGKAEFRYFPFNQTGGIRQGDVLFVSLQENI